MRTYLLMGIILLVIAGMIAIGTLKQSFGGGGMAFGLCFTAGACFIADAIITSRK